MQSSLTFIERHMFAQQHSGAPVAWPALRFMTCDIQYGGRVTDEADKNVLAALTSAWIGEHITVDGAKLSPADMIEELPSAFAYQ